VSEFDTSGQLEVDILANASPIGMSPLVDDMAVTKEAISKAKLVFDAIYTPPVTKLLKVRSCQLLWALPSQGCGWIIPLKLANISSVCYADCGGDGHSHFQRL
jgi:shikimate 5-dehydrogenase